MNMWTRTYVTVFVALAILAWTVVLRLQGTQVSLGHIALFIGVVGFLVLSGSVFDRLLWHQRLLRGWFVQRPDLRGTWTVELKSDWIDPVTKIPVPTINGFFAITQTFSTLRLRFMTVESASYLIAD